MIKIKNLQKNMEKEYKGPNPNSFKMKSWKNYIGNPKLARLAADITGDGHLQLQDWRGIVSFYSNNIKTIEETNLLFKSLFDIEGKIYPKYGGYGKQGRHRIYFISKPLAKFFEDIGVPKGNKTNQAFYVPNWIFNGSKIVQKAYLRALFTGEGSIFRTKQKNKPDRWRIGIEMYKWTKYKHEGKQFMEQIKEMLKNQGIISSPVRFGRRNLRKDETESIAIKLDIESRQFGKFYKHIGFDDTNKTEKLESFLRGCKS